MQKSTVSASAAFIFKSGNKAQRVAGDRAVLLRAADRILERAMLGHGAARVFKIGVVDLAAFERPPPEFPLGLGAAPEGEYDRQRDFAFAEIVADILAGFAEARRNRAHRRSAGT